MPEFTVSACINCRKRKRKCDTLLPSCMPCVKAGLRCEFYDPVTDVPVPRQRICELEEELNQLMSEDPMSTSSGGLSDGLGSATATPGTPMTTTSSTGSGPGRKVQSLISEKIELINIKVNGNDEKVFLGHSSGLQLAQVLMEKLQGGGGGGGGGGANTQPEQEVDGVTNTSNTSASVTPGPSFAPHSTVISPQPFPDGPNQPQPQPQTQTQTHPPTITSGAINFGWAASHGGSSSNPLPPISSFLYLVSQYMEQSEVRYPIFVRANLIDLVVNVYHGVDCDAHSLCAMSLIMAISLQISSRNDSRLIPLAGEYYQRALPFLRETCAYTSDLRTLQCLLLVIVYSLLNPSRVPVWHLSGIALRMALHMGLNRDEVVCAKESDLLQRDLRRRLWWSTYAVDRGLCLAVGRPLTILEKGSMTTQYPSTLEDSCIQAGSRAEPVVNQAKTVTYHWFGLRRLQSEVVETLYMNSKHKVTSDNPWFADIHRRFELWCESAPPSPTGPLDNNWVKHGFNNGILLLYRPSPANPEPARESYLICYRAAAENLVLYRNMIEAKSIDITWLICHYLFVCGISLLYTYHSSPEVRECYSIEDLKNSSMLCSMSLKEITERWPSAHGMLKAFNVLAQVPIKAHEAVMAEAAEAASAAAAATLTPTPATLDQGMLPGQPLPMSTDYQLGTNGANTVQGLLDDSYFFDGQTVEGMTEQDVLQQIFLDYYYPTEIEPGFPV